MLSVATSDSRTQSITVIDARRKQYVLRYRNSYRIQFIINIYILNLINTLVFGSLISPFIAWLSAGLITLIVEKAPHICLKYLQKLFYPTANVTDYYNILYLCRHIIKIMSFVTVVILLIFISLMIN
jgi:hypothetical protein